MQDMSGRGNIWQPHSVLGSRPQGLPGMQRCPTSSRNKSCAMDHGRWSRAFELAPCVRVREQDGAGGRSGRSG